MTPICVTIICLINALLCSSYSPSENGGEHAVNYRYNAGAGLKVQLPCNLGQGTYGAGSSSVKNFDSSTTDCLCKLKNTKPGSEDNDSFQYFIKVSGRSPSSLECDSPNNEGLDNNTAENVKLGFLEIPCSLGTNNYWLGYWTKQKLSTSTVQCLCELGNTKTGSFILKPYDFFVEKTGIKLWSLDCNQKGSENDDESTSTSSDDQENPTPATLYTYDLDYSLDYMQKYDIESYLSSSKYYWNNNTLWVNFIDGINESNQPKFSVANIKANINDEKWMVEDFTDLSLCEKYPENSLYFNLQKTVNQLIFEDDNGCSVKPGTNVTISRSKRLSITIDEKISCGSNLLYIVLQSPANENAVGLYWSYDLPVSSDCIDYSIEEEREKEGLKKAFISTPLVNVTRDHLVTLSSRDEYFKLDQSASNENITWLSYPSGWDTNSNVILSSINWIESRFLFWSKEESNITSPCDNAAEFTVDKVALNIFKLLMFQGKDCPIEKDSNLTVSAIYPDMEVDSYVLFPCGLNVIQFYFSTADTGSFLGFVVGSWNVPNTTQCLDYSTY